MTRENEVVKRAYTHEMQIVIISKHSINFGDRYYKIEAN